MEAKIWCGVFVTLLAFVSFLNVSVANEKVLTLDHSNFTHTVSKHSFIVVEFYAPWCGHCNALAPEYEKAASVLSSHDPPIVLAKVDVNEEVNTGLATEFEVQGFPTIKILKNGGKISQDYKGPRNAEGIVDYLKKQVGPPSVEIRSAEDVASFIDEKSIFVVGVFPKYSGEEFENFMALADKLRSDYSFAHTLDAKILPHGEVVDKPTIRLFKPFDELFVDSQDFQADTMEKFIEDATTPILTVWNSDPNNHPYINKFFESSHAKAMLFVNFSKEHDYFQPKYKEIAASYKGKGISFLFGDADVTQNAFQYFGLKEEQAPVLIIQDAEGQKYLKEKVEPNQIESWMKDYTDGKIKPFIRSEPIPEINNEPVKVVVRDSLLDVVFSSGKNVLLEFYAPWCGHCQQLAPILDEVAISFENDTDIIIAKFDATANDVPSEIFDVQGFPTVYFISSSGSLSQYEGDRTKEDIIDFIQKNKNKPSQSISGETEAAKSESVNRDSSKDEL